jgi:5-methylcytosine-specific restriction endonuclease McrA
MEHDRSLESVPDDELLRRLSELLRQSRRVEADLVAHIGEVDARRLYAREASPSMFAYCTEVLHLSEAEAYLRIAAARASREHPMLLTMLVDGRLHLTAIAKLAPNLTRENRDGLLTRAAHKTRRQIEELIAGLAPRPDAPAVMRKLPERRTATAQVQALRDGAGRAASATLELRPDGAEPPEPALRLDGVAAANLQLRPDGVATPPAPALASAAAIQPLSPARYRVQFTASAELRDKLERLQALMRSAVPDGDLAAIIDRAVTEKLERLEARRFAKSNAPRKGSADSDTSPSSRHIPAAVRRIVHERDGRQCRYVDGQGRRCTARGDLEFHHRHPFGHGGDHSPEGISLLCRTHNNYMAEIDYGRQPMEQHRRSGDRVSKPPAAHAIGSVVGPRAPGVARWGSRSNEATSPDARSPASSSFARQSCLGRG